jgi:hypothetical protein
VGEGHVIQHFTTADLPKHDPTLNKDFPRVIIFNKQAAQRAALAHFQNTCRVKPKNAGVFSK